MPSAVRAPLDGEPAGERPAPVVLAPTRTESFWLVRLYRILMPRALRAHVARRVSPELRNRFILRAAAGGPLRRLADRCPIAWFHARHRALVAPATRGLARVQGRVRLVEIRADATPLRARRETLDLVCAARHDAGIDHFRVRPLDDRESAVGVSSADRDRALHALVAGCGDAGAYVSVGKGRPERGARAWQRLGEATVITVVRYYSTPDGRLVLGPEHGC